MKLILPSDAPTGWGTCSKYLREELAKLPSFPGDDGVVIQAITGPELLPMEPSVRGKINIGYTFFEDNLIARSCVPTADAIWDWVVTGSSWCTAELKKAGLKNVSTIIQGVDHSIFKPSVASPSTDRFVVFSGGKIEYRKGQDIVIAAMKEFMHRHDDVDLNCAWSNAWPASVNTILRSNLIKHSDKYGFNKPGSPYWYDVTCMALAENGIPSGRVFTVHGDSQCMADAYKASHVGLFPNRCEGGTNLVMMEYMACGKPVIASLGTGHSDVVDGNHAITLRTKPETITDANGIATGEWRTPCVSHVIDALELAYRNRPEIEQMGKRAAEFMKPFTWESTAKQFHDLAVRLAGETEQAVKGK